MFKPGDKVRVIAKIANDQKRIEDKVFRWVYRMDEMIGKEFEVVNGGSFCNRGVCLNHPTSGKFYFHPSDLELIPEPAKFKVGDKVLTIGFSDIGTDKDRLGEVIQVCAPPSPQWLYRVRLSDTLWLGYAEENLSPAPAESKITKTQRIEALEARNTQLEKDITAVGDRLVAAQSGIDRLIKQNVVQQKQNVVQQKQIDTLTKRCDLIQGQKQSADQTESAHKAQFRERSFFDTYFIRDPYSYLWRGF